MTALNNSPYLDIDPRTEREVRRERSLQVLSGKLCKAGLPTGEVQTCVEGVRSAHLMHDLIDFVKGVR